MRRLLLLLFTVWGTDAVARIFRDPGHFRSHNFASAYSSRRILRSPGSSQFARSRVFRNVVVNANDEPRLRSQGRFYKRAQAVPIHDPAQQPAKDAIHITGYSYDEEKHHEKKLVEDSMTMVEAHDFARGLERTTVSVKAEETTPLPLATTPIPMTFASKSSTTGFGQAFQPPQPAPAFKQPAGSRTFAQTVQAGALNVPNAVLPRPLGFNGPPPPFQMPPQPQVPPFPGFVPAVPGTPAIPGRFGLPPDPLVAPLGIPQPPIIPPTPPAGVSPANIPNFTPPTIPPQPPSNQLPPHINGPTGGAGGAHHPPNGSPPLPVRDTRFEVINQQSANSSLEQLGCGFDWLTNTCKDVFNIGWCGRCHDFGNIFLHDCKCIQPLVQLPPRPPPPQPRPALLRYI